jgi:hypothetical protein
LHRLQQENPAINFVEFETKKLHAPSLGCVFDWLMIKRQ